MIKTDPLTGFLMAKFVSREEKKNYEDTLLCALHKAHDAIAEKLCIAQKEELPEIAYEAAGVIIQNRLSDELEKAIAHLADTLALACDVGEKSTARKRKKLKKMAEQAVELEAIKLAILENAMRAVDFAHIAEVLINIGKKKAEEAAVGSAAGKESAGE